MPMSGADLIRAERFRQISSENYPPEGDVGRTQQLATAAAAYALSAAGPFGGLDFITRGSQDLAPGWPWAPERWKPKSTKRDLIRAGALIAAAIDSLEEDD